jgi:16S rRNA (uracil1498-N3)-methyltransferase
METGAIDGPRPLAARGPRFFLATPHRAAAPRLLAGEAQHALRVLRLGPGDPLLGLDGEGGLWPLRIARAERDELELAPAGEPERDPAPGEPGAPLPWIELAVSWPRKGRAEEMLSALVQLGAAAITPLDARWRGNAPAPRAPDERWLRIAREACKQCERTWLPELSEAKAPSRLLEERAGAAIAVLDARQGMSFDTWARSIVPGHTAGIGTRERPILLAVGPEGGFTPEERELFLLRGATFVSLAPHVLRVETAAVAALAVAVCILKA